MNQQSDEKLLKIPNKGSSVLGKLGAWLGDRWNLSFWFPNVKILWKRTKEVFSWVFMGAIRHHDDWQSH